MSKIVLDSNIIFSAVAFDGSVRQHLFELVHSPHLLIVSNYILKETKSVLIRNGVFDQTSARQLFHFFKQNFHLVKVSSILSTDIVTDPKDHPILITAIKAKADYLVTGDLQLRKVGHIGPTQILTLSEFLNSET